MLGTFHMAKNAMRCCGKFLRGSGIETCLIEPVVFGSKILEQVLTGSHYYRSFAGLCVIEDAIMQLKIEAFLERNTNSLSPAGREAITALRKSLVDMDGKKSKLLLASAEVQNALSNEIEAVRSFTEKMQKGIFYVPILRKFYQYSW